MALQTTHKLSEYRQEASRLYQDGKYDEALIVCERILETAPGDAEATNLKGKCAQFVGDIKATQAQIKLQQELRRILDRVSGVTTPQDRILIAFDALKIDPASGEAYQILGYAYNDKKEYDTAYKHFSKAIELTPALAYSYYGRAIITSVIYEKPDEAIADFQMVVKYDPESYIGYIAKGNLEMKQNKTDDALKSYSTAIELNPKHNLAYLNRASIYRDKGDFEKALDDADTGIELQPQYARAYMTRSSIYARINNIDLAIADCTKSISLEPTAMSYCIRGDYRLMKMEPDKAIADFTKALALDHSLLTVFVRRGDAYTDKGDFERALDDYATVIHMVPDAPQSFNVYNSRGILYFQQAQQHQESEQEKLIAKALADFDKAIALNPHSAIAYANRGTIYQKKGRHSNAIADCAKAIELKPDSVTYYTRGVSYAAIEEFEKALADFASAIRLSPDYFYAYNDRGSVYYDQARRQSDSGARTELLNKALTDYTTASKLNPGYVDALYNRGLIYYEKGELDKAISEYTNVINIDPKFSNSYCNRGIAYAAKSNEEQDQESKIKLQDKALSDYSKAIKLNSANSQALNNRGGIYLGRGELDKALIDFNAAIMVSPHVPDFYYNRALTYALQTKLEFTIQDCRKYLKLAPGTPLAKKARELLEESQRILNSQGK